MTEETKAIMTATNSSVSGAAIGYILKGYPRTSETFITNEIRLLEKLGLELAIFSVKKLEGQQQHAMVDRIGVPVTYLPQADPLSETRFPRWALENVPKFAASHRRLFLSRPWAYLAMLLECLAMSVRYRKGLFGAPRAVFFKEFLQGGFIAQAVLEAGNIGHLHAHFCHGSTTIAMFASRLSGIPYSFTAHAKDIYLRELNPGDLLPKKMRRAEFLVTCTGANEEHLQRIAPAGTAVHRIYHGLDTRLFDAPEAGDNEPPKVPLILSVGRLVEKKGFPDLIKACQLLRRRGLQFRCRIVGGGEPDYRDVLQRLIDDLGLQDTVKMSGAVTQEELREIYQKADLFALPCQVVANGDRDGIPNVLVEAMAMRVPVVSTEISGIPELIEHEVNGLLVAEKNPSAMAAALERLLLDPELGRRIAQAGRERVCRDFDSEHTTRVLKQLFVEQLQQNQAVSYAKA